MSGIHDILRHREKYAIINASKSILRWQVEASLIQLCDSIAAAEGVVDMEVRMEG